ncbi:MAG: polyprenyl glycosylphosphotransferase [Bacteroidia bacterium]|nr:MAG: polyprenyl glycosylphosphotransferase [Bacteroidia bacterium]
MPNKRKMRYVYVLADYLAAATARFLFFLFRKSYIEQVDFFLYEKDFLFYLSLWGIPLMWVLWFAFLGHYRNVYRRSRLLEFWHTLTASFIGCSVLFFFLILDDVISSYTDYYKLFSALFLLQFICTFIPRLFLFFYTSKKIKSGKIGFKTLLIGGNSDSLRLYHNLQKNKDKHGHIFVGYADDPEESGKELPRLGSLQEIQKIVKEKQIEEITVPVSYSKTELLQRMIRQLQYTDTLIKVEPEPFATLQKRVNLTGFLGVPMQVVSYQPMKAWQENIKKIFDISASFLAILLLLPVYLFIAAAIKLDSKGSIFFCQERIGKHGKPFLIYKFRTMRPDAESEGPQLSSEKDKRVTRLGRFLRKSRLDETPQFFNVLQGKMSIVGPRPERQFYIDQILQKAPAYSELLNVKPGITSWGQIKFGYAENVDEMLARLKFDLFYIRNRSLYIDVKILIHTVLEVLKGSGK